MDSPLTIHPTLSTGQDTHCTVVTWLKWLNKLSTMSHVLSCVFISSRQHGSARCCKERCYRCGHQPATEPRVRIQHRHQPAAALGQYSHTKHNQHCHDCPCLQDTRVTNIGIIRMILCFYVLRNHLLVCHRHCVLFTHPFSKDPK